MFDWPKILKQFWPAIILSLALLLILDGTISSLETCHPPNSASGGQNSDKDCTVLQGPLISLIIGIGDFVGDHDKGIVAAFTAILALSTIGLWTATINLYKAGKDQLSTSRKIAAIQARQTRSSIKEAIKASAAAEKSANAAVAVERARFYAVIEHNFTKCIDAAAAWDGPRDQEERDLPIDVTPMAKIRFKNYGKTPGIIYEVGCGIEYSEKVPDPVFDVKAMSENMIAAGEFSESFGEVISGMMTMTQAKKVRSGRGTIWIFGYANYEDVFGERQVHSFFQRLIPASQFRYILQPYDYKHYNRST
jgi:hypothetical protein